MLLHQLIPQIFESLVQIFCSRTLLIVTVEAVCNDAVKMFVERHIPNDSVKALVILSRQFRGWGVDDNAIFEGVKVVMEGTFLVRSGHTEKNTADSPNVGLMRELRVLKEFGGSIGVCATSFT